MLRSIFKNTVWIWEDLNNSRNFCSPKMQGEQINFVIKFLGGLGITLIIIKKKSRQ